jgi:hypothetical protein
MRATELSQVDTSILGKLVERLPKNDNVVALFRLQGDELLAYIGGAGQDVPARAWLRPP